MFERAKLNFSDTDNSDGSEKIMTMFPKVAKEPIQRIIDGCLAHFQPFRNFISRQTFLKPKTKDQVAIAPCAWPPA